MVNYLLTIFNNFQSHFVTKLRSRVAYFLAKVNITFAYRRSVNEVEPPYLKGGVHFNKALPCKVIPIQIKEVNLLYNMEGFLSK